jgi:trehalose-6-phosphate synthase
MDPAERASRADQMRRIVNENDVTKWLAAQQVDIERKLERSRERAMKEAR